MVRYMCPKFNVHPNLLRSAAPILSVLTTDYSVVSFHIRLLGKDRPILEYND